MRRLVMLALFSTLLASVANAQIPSTERDALIALYNGTDGANWSDNTNWLGAVGTECTWHGVTCSGGNVWQLNLSANQLVGSIPAELGDLSNLNYLDLYSNQLSGSIPPELGNLSVLGNLWLDSNQLSGSIPPELGDLPQLQKLGLNSNQLTGGIPPELGNLSSLTSLYLHSNQLSGIIPPELGDLSILGRLFLHSNQLKGSIPGELGSLSTLIDATGLDLRWNALHTDDAGLIAFFNSKQRYGDWQSTQTIPPENLTADSAGDHTVWLSWDAVSYQADPGGYSVFSAPTGTGVWTSHGWTESKTTATYPATGLDPATTYDFAVVTYTDPHGNNGNLVNSNFSPEEMATTASGGCPEPVIEITWDDPITLSVSGTWGSYSWSTGETTATIDVTPLFDQWYWVTVTSAGPCEETGAVWVDPTAPVFFDGFESGDTTEWSSSVP